MDKSFKPNVEWMAAKYDEMNNRLFDGKLGNCDFGIFTTGRGSQGGVLGWFKITRKVRINRYSSRMSSIYGNADEIDRSNFYELCRPRIELNGNYSGTEYGFLSTLVHEMCHYYTYMNGYCPKQSHGREFKEIGMIVSYRSNGLFTIQRIASAEQMNELELSDEMKQKKQNRIDNKKSKVSIILRQNKKGIYELTLSSSQSVIDFYIGYAERHHEKMKISNNKDAVEFIFNKGYRKNMRTPRFWYLDGKPWIDEFKRLVGFDGDETDIQQQQIENTPKKRVFSIRTNNGTFEYDASSVTQLERALRDRFPKMNDDAIAKIMNNPANYKIMENRKSIKHIIREVINELMGNEFNGANNEDTIEITPDMNLGEFSPFELER